MQLLRTIRDGDDKTLESREAARAILFGQDGKMPILFVSKHKYHKLPGGGIDTGEGEEGALAREVMEETGCKIRITGEVGKVVEHRSRYRLRQISYCYLGRVTSKGKPSFTRKETNQGFRLAWMSLEDAISRLERDKPGNYEGRFIRERDLAFLKKARGMKA